MNVLLALDPHTLLVVNAANVLVLAVTLLVVMGAKLSNGARCARASLVAQAFGWIVLIFSGRFATYWLDLSVSTLAVACFSFGNGLLFRGLKGWLGPREGESVLYVLLILMPVGYAVSFESYTWRVAWVDFVVSAQYAILARAALFPESKMVGRWRWGLTFCMLVMAALSLARAMMSVLSPDFYSPLRAPHPFNLAYFLIADITAVIVNVSVLVGWHEEAEQQLRDQAVTDPLTTVLNRHGWNENVARVFAQARRHRLPLALLLIDLDHFKQINDLRGHEAGDAALSFFGKILRREQRAGDIVARVGGEEFYVLMPMTDEAAARAFERRIRQHLAASAVARLGHALDYSAGLACLESADDKLEALTQRVDKALYLAKSSGRGRLAKL